MNGIQRNIDMFERCQTVSVHGFVFCFVTITLAEAGGKDDHNREEENLLSPDLTALGSIHHSSIRTPEGILAPQSHLREHIGHTVTLSDWYTVTLSDWYTVTLSDWYTGTL